MKQTVFSQDDRFFLRMQRRDLIYTSESAEDQKSNKWKTEKSRASYGSILNQDEAINKEQKDSLRKLLQRFENRRLRDEEFRILQGVLLKDFGDLEMQKKRQKELNKEKSAFKRKTVSAVTNQAQEKALMTLNTFKQSQLFSKSSMAGLGQAIGRRNRANSSEGARNPLGGLALEEIAIEENSAASEDRQSRTSPRLGHRKQQSSGILAQKLPLNGSSDLSIGF